MNPQLAIALYRPLPGQDDALRELIARHLPTLRRLELVTEQPGILARSTDGTYLEIFAWRSPAAKDAAHQHPRVAEIWESMAEVAEFLPLASLEEAHIPFSNFALVQLGQGS